MPAARVGAIVLHYRLVGPAEAPVLAFSNSLGTDFRIWDGVAERLAGAYRILLYDKRGHGLTGLGTPPYGLDDHVRDLAGLLAHLRIERLSLVGLSVGGLIAQRFAALNPGRLDALVLADTAARIGTPDLWNDRIAAVQAGGIGAIAEPILERWFSRAYRESRPDDVALWRAMLTRTPAAGYAGTCAAIRDADLTAAAAGLAVPTLCLVGAEDGSTPPPLVEATARLIPGARFAIIDRAGHLPPIEQPAVFADQLSAHLREAGLER